MLLLACRYSYWHVDYNRLVLSVCTCRIKAYIRNGWVDNLINPDLPASDAIRPIKPVITTMEAELSNVGKTDNVWKDIYKIDVY